MQENIDEAEETLSLCDLQIYSDSPSSEQFYYNENQSSPSSSLEQNFFEFFNEEWSDTTFISSYNPPDHIIFCGKLIPSKQPISQNTHKLKTNSQTIPQMNRGLSRRNSDSFYVTKKASKPSTISRSKFLPVPERSRYQTTKCGDKNDVLAQRVSILASPTKSRWYLFMFGLARFPTQMELDDIRSRQIRLSPSTMFRFNGGGGEEMSAFRRSAKGLWGLIGALSCSGRHHTNSVVKASFGCIPPV